MCVCVCVCVCVWSVKLITSADGPHFSLFASLERPSRLQSPHTETKLDQPRALNMGLHYTISAKQLHTEELWLVSVFESRLGVTAPLSSWSSS
jgi:hypothetical protein